MYNFRGMNKGEAHKGGVRNYNSNGFLGVYSRQNTLNFHLADISDCDWTAIS